MLGRERNEVTAHEPHTLERDLNQGRIVPPLQVPEWRRTSARRTGLRRDEMRYKAGSEGAGRQMFANLITWLLAGLDSLDSTGTALAHTPSRFQSITSSQYSAVNRRIQIKPWYVPFHCTCALYWFTTCQLPTRTAVCAVQLPIPPCHSPAYLHLHVHLRCGATAYR